MHLGLPTQKPFNRIVDRWPGFGAGGQLHRQWGARGLVNPITESRAPELLEACSSSGPGSAGHPTPSRPLWAAWLLCRFLTSDLQELVEMNQIILQVSSTMVKWEEHGQHFLATSQGFFHIASRITYCYPPLSTLHSQRLSQYFLPSPHGFMAT